MKLELNEDNPLAYSLAEKVVEWIKDKFKKGDENV